jgi:hypothetical protein
VSGNEMHDRSFCCVKGKFDFIDLNY